jgi:serine/threonine protein kinase
VIGLAKVLDSGTGATESVTVAGRVIGTLGYMAPEMVNGGLVNERADLFAIGVMVVEMLTGSRPLEEQRSKRSFWRCCEAKYWESHERLERWMSSCNDAWRKIPGSVMAPRWSWRRIWFRLSRAAMATAGPAARHTEMPLPFTRDSVPLAMRET